MPTKRILSFKYAFDGIWTALKEEPNLKFHFLAALVTLGLAWYFQVTVIEWLILVIVIGLVMAIELTNTAIEEIVNSFTQNAHPAAKKAKDVSAGAVLVISIMAFYVGLIIFIPYFLKLLG